MTAARAPRTATCTALALVAFASNSILCRLALRGRAIDPASFTLIRLVAGALALTLILALSGRDATPRSGDWISSLCLFLYAAAFSFAYLSLGAGSGALILFGAVQLTMIAAARYSGERPHALEWIGLLFALAGLVYLTSPGLSAPSPAGSVLMAAAGGAWGLYSLRGRGAVAPLAATAGNFVRAVPLAVAAGVIALPHVHVSGRGVLLAATSGALASGVGYAIWYLALSGLSATRAATVQLAVPVLAAALAVVFLAETITLRLVIAALVILGGVGLALVPGWRKHRNRFYSGAALPGPTGRETS